MAQLGNLLRLVGPLIQIVCLIGVFRYRGQGLRIGRLPLETALFGGFVVGAALVVTGLALVRVAQWTRARSVAKPDGLTGLDRDFAFATEEDSVASPGHERDPSSMDDGEGSSESPGEPAMRPGDYGLTKDLQGSPRTGTDRDSGNEGGM